MSDARHVLPTGPTVHDVLGIEVVEASTERVVLEVEVGPQVHQPYGILHGGVSALLAEGAASMLGALNVPVGKSVVGTDLNCSHLRPMTSGRLRAYATAVRIGRTMAVVAIDLKDQDDRLICVARCTLAVIDTPAPR